MTLRWKRPTVSLMRCSGSSARSTVGGKALEVRRPRNERSALREKSRAGYLNAIPPSVPRSQRERPPMSRVPRRTATSGPVRWRRT